MKLLALATVLAASVSSLTLKSEDQEQHKSGLYFIYNIDIIVDAK
jgi:hypothetical protein